MDKIVVVGHGFQKKTQKTPKQQIERAEQIKKERLSGQNMEITYRDIGVRIQISLDEEIDTSRIEEGNDSILGYNAKVQIRDGIKLGSRNLDDFQEFINLATKTQDIIWKELFGGERQVQKFIICDIKRGIKPLDKYNEISDKKLSSKIKFKNDSIQIVTSEPYFLLRCIRKYISY